VETELLTAFALTILGQVMAFDLAMIYNLATVYDPTEGLDSSTGCVSANTCNLGKMYVQTHGFRFSDSKWPNSGFSLSNGRVVVEALYAAYQDLEPWGFIEAVGRLVGRYVRERHCPETVL
jgi:hypothetical protein